MDALTPTLDQENSKTELVIGLVGAIGTDLELVSTRLCSTLRDVFAYDCTRIGVSDLLADLDWDGKWDLHAPRWDVRTRARMDAGLELCRAWKSHDALAQLSVLAISRRREELGNRNDEPLHRHAFVLKSLKRPAEVDFLRAIYGHRFVLIGAYAPRENRRAAILERLEEAYETRDESKFEVDVDRDLLARDERESGEGGQNVRDTFHRADFFVETHTKQLDKQVRRSLHVLFGDPVQSPTKDENAMAHADRAARRSAEPGRQVGAAVMNDRGDVLATGCNEVPRANGGQYWGDDVDGKGKPAPDGREVRKPVDTNNHQQAEIAADIVRQLKAYLNDEARADPATLSAQVLDSRLGETTEFGRAVHAEMAAITTAARVGTPLLDATLLTDTFPCHNCARHIVATGIRRVVYIAPYAKSRAHELHGDAIAVAPADPDAVADKVAFEPFIGIAPRRFDLWFSGVRRKDDSGTIRTFEPNTAIPRVGATSRTAAELEVIATAARETAALTQLSKRLSTLSPTLAELIA